MTAVAYAKWVGAAVAVIAYSLFWYHMGGQGTRLNVAQAQVKQTTANLQTQKIDDSTIALEAKAFNDAKRDPDPVPAPVVRLCHYTPTVLPTAGARPVAPATPAPRGADPVPGNPPPDIGPGLVHLGRVGDAQIAALQDYIGKVCLNR